MQQETTNNLPWKLLPFIWQYLKYRKLYLLGFAIVGLFVAAEVSIAPYLLKIIIDAVVAHQNEATLMLQAILPPALAYVMVSLLLNLNFRLLDYLNLQLYPAIKAEVIRDMFA